MQFLQNEFEDLPSEMVQQFVAQIEMACRQARQLTQHTTSSVSSLQYVAICAKIGSVIELADRFRRTIRQGDEDQAS